MGHSDTEKDLVLNVITFIFAYIYIYIYIYHINAHEWVSVSTLFIIIPTRFDGFWVNIRDRTCLSFSGFDYVDNNMLNIVLCFVKHVKTL
jgi:hypothetical protein